MPNIWHNVFNCFHWTGRGDSRNDGQLVDWRRDAAGYSQSTRSLIEVSISHGGTPKVSTSVALPKHLYCGHKVEMIVDYRHMVTLIVDCFHNTHCPQQRAGLFLNVFECHFFVIFHKVQEKRAGFHVERLLLLDSKEGRREQLEPLRDLMHAQHSHGSEKKGGVTGRKQSHRQWKGYAHCLINHSTSFPRRRIVHGSEGGGILRNICSLDANYFLLFFVGNLHA